MGNFRITNDEPVSRRDAARGYRVIRGSLVLSALFLGAIAILAAALEISGWKILLAGLVLEAIWIPVFLRIYRRELEEKVRAYERSAF
ncbi:MAG TPA: hypothetical protein VGF04_06170 [Solirubrobacterales bacterium]|jgi:hypothetical protein